MGGLLLLQLVQSQVGFDTHEDFFYLKGFGDEVYTAHVKSFDLIEHIAHSADEDDWNIAGDFVML